jgi:hypothetical protein
MQNWLPILAVLFSKGSDEFSTAKVLVSQLVLA